MEILIFLKNEKYNMDILNLGNHSSPRVTFVESHLTNNEYSHSAPLATLENDKLVNDKHEKHASAIAET